MVSRRNFRDITDFKDKVKEIGIKELYYFSSVQQNDTVQKGQDGSSIPAKQIVAIFQVTAVDPEEKKQLIYDTLLIDKVVISEADFKEVEEKIATHEKEFIDMGHDVLPSCKLICGVVELLK